MRVLAVLVLASVFFSLTSGGTIAAQACKAFPKVPWWQGINHNSVKRFVAREYKGDWQRHISAWDKQLERLTRIHGRGNVAIVKPENKSNGEKPTQSIRVGGENLATYIGMVRQRIKVIRCLAREETDSRTKKTEITAEISAAPLPIPNIDAGARAVRVGGCSRCHGPSGISPVPTVPNLAGQNETYLTKQLAMLRGGKNSNATGEILSERHNQLMRRRLVLLDRREISNVAAYYANLPACILRSGGAESSAMPKSVTVCAGCHGRDGKSLFPEVPNLAGQKERYLHKQLLLFNSGKSASIDQTDASARYHHVMSEAVRTLTQDQFAEVAAYFANLRCIR